MFGMNNEEKYRVTLLSTMVTLILRSSTWVTVIAIVPPGVNPFLDAAFSASVFAAAKSGISAAPASAAESAARCTCAPRAYQAPMSTANPAKAISGTRSRAVITIV